MSVPFLGASRLSQIPWPLLASEGIDMSLGIEREDAPAADHWRSGEAGLAIRTLAGIGFPQLA